MLRPDFVLVLSGGNAGQVLSKNSNVDGDYVWSTPSSGGSPGGSTTQIQFNNAGVFGGTSDFVYDGTKIASNVKIEASNASGTFFDGTGTITLGDYSAVGAGSFLSITDSSQTFDLKANTTIRLKNYGGTVSIGDVDSDVNSTRVNVDDPNYRIELNAAKPVIGNTSGNGQYVYDSGTSTYWQWQSVNGVWTGTDTTSGSLP